MIQQDVYEVVLREGMDGVDGYQQRVNERFLSEGVVFGKFNWADVRGTTESPAQDIAEVDTPSNARLTGEELEGIHQDEEEEHPLHLMNKHPLHVKSMMEETPAPTEVAQLALAHIDIEQPGVATAGPDGNCLAQIDIAMDCKPLDGPAQAKPASKRRKGGSRKKSQVKPDCVPLNIVPSSASKKRIVESKKDCIVGKDIKTVLQNTYHPYLTQQIYDLSCGTGLSLRYAIGYRGQSSEKRKVLEVDGELCEYAIVCAGMAERVIRKLKLCKKLNIPHWKSTVVVAATIPTAVKELVFSSITEGLDGVAQGGSEGRQLLQPITTIPVVKYHYNPYSTDAPQKFLNTPPASCRDAEITNQRKEVAQCGNATSQQSEVHQFVRSQAVVVSLQADVAATIPTAVKELVFSSITEGLDGVAQGGSEGRQLLQPITTIPVVKYHYNPYSTDAPLKFLNTPPASCATPSTFFISRR